MRGCLPVQLRYPTTGKTEVKVHLLLGKFLLLFRFLSLRRLVPFSQHMMSVWVDNSQLERVPQLQCRNTYCYYSI